MRRIAWLFGMLLGHAGCASSTLDLPAASPANAKAKSVPLPTSSHVLSADFDVAGVEANVPPNDAGEHHHHPGMTMPEAPPAMAPTPKEPTPKEPAPTDMGTPRPPPRPVTPAPRPPTPASPAKPAQKTVYTCPMHPEIALPEPGNCPKCGMPLVPRKETP